MEWNITDEEFLAILRENYGLYARTARAISEKYGVDYSRQAVYGRALNHKEVLQDIRESSIDTAEEAMNELMKSTDEEIKFKSSKYVLGTLGKKRGYVERTEVSPVDPDGNAVQPIININVIRNKKDDDNE